MDRITLKLAYPIKVDRHNGETVVTETISELSLAPRILGRHMKAADFAKGPVEAQLLIFASLAGIDRSLADEFDQADIAAIEAAVDGETSDLQRIAIALGLPITATVTMMVDAIAKRNAPLVAVTPAPIAAEAPSTAPLDDGPETGSRSLAT